MKLYRIVNLDGGWLEVRDEDIDRVDAYAEDGKIDVKSKRFAARNKSRTFRDFKILIRVSKRIDGKTKFRKRRFSFPGTEKEGATLVQAIEDLSGVAKELRKDLEKSVTDREERQAQELRKREGWTVSEVWKAFSDGRASGSIEGRRKAGPWKPATRQYYDAVWNALVNRPDGKRLAGTVALDIEEGQIKAIVDRVEKDMSPRSAAAVLDVLRPALEWHYAKLGKALPSEIVPRKAALEEKIAKRVVDIELSVVRHLFERIDTYDDDLFRRFFKFVRLGRRVGETISIRIENIDLRDDTFLIEAGSAKGGFDQVFPLLPELREELPKHPGVWLFPQPRNPMWHIDRLSYRRHWRRIKADMGNADFKLNGRRVSLEKLHVHDFRHIASTIWKRAQVPPHLRARLLGHTVRDLEVTDGYGIDDVEELRRAQTLLLDIVRGNIPEDTLWRDYR